jgi:hypothetical protein
VVTMTLRETGIRNEEIVGHLHIEWATRSLCSLLFMPSFCPRLIKENNKRTYIIFHEIYFFS